MIDTLSERHLLPMSTLTACLRCVCRVGFDGCSSSFFRFGKQLREKGRPRGIENAFRKAMGMYHPIDRQVFDTDDSKAVNDGTGLLMGEIVTMSAAWKKQPMEVYL